MTKLFSIPVLILSVLIFFSASCKKDEGKLPNIAFKTGGIYTSTDTPVSRGAVVTMGITASKAEDKDVLKTFDASRVYDGGAPESFFSETLSGSNEDNYNKDITITTRNMAGTEKYTFTVVNKDGLKNSVRLTLTVN